jgi:hypothetical protein
MERADKNEGGLPYPEHKMMIILNRPYYICHINYGG